MIGNHAFRFHKFKEPTLLDALKNKEDLSVKRNTHKHLLAKGEASLLAKEVSKHTIELLKRYDNSPTEEHIKALETIAHCLVDNGLVERKGKSRIALPLYTGGGKTLSITAYLSQLYHRKIDLGVWIATGTIEQLESLKEELIKNGVPELEIGIKSSIKPRTKKEKATAVTEDNAHRFKFILVTHQRIKACQIDYLLEYKGEQRQLIWDEALITTQGVSIPVNSLLNSISCWSNTYSLRKRGFERGDITELHSRTDTHLDMIKTMIELVNIGGCINIPEKDFNLALDLYSDNVLVTLDNIQSGTARIIRDIGNQSAVMSFVIEVPDQLEKICILDASAPIKRLMQYDNSIDTVPIEVSKDYSTVTLHVCRTYAGRNTVSDPNKNIKLYEELAHIITREIPCNGDTIVFGLPEREGEENQEDRLRRFLSGDYAAMSKVEMVSWGRAKGINSLVDYKYGTHIGIPYRNKNELAASINGQRRDLKNTVTEKEVFDTQASEHIDLVYQAISRLACRKTVEGKAGETEFYLFYPNDRLIPGLKKLMPGIKVKEYIPKYLEHKVSNFSIVDMIIDYLTENKVRKVSISKLRKDLGITINNNSKHWVQVIDTLNNGHLSKIGYKINGRSIVTI